MNLTFVHDGYLALNALESSFQLFVFDGYLIYGEVPPTPTTQSGDGVRRHEELNQDNLKRIIEQDNQDWMDLICIFLRCQN